MNERIKKLADEAGMTKILNEHASEYGNGVFENTPYPELEKFAELIIKECASFVESSRLVGVFEKEPEKVAPYLEEYFGIK